MRCIGDYTLVVHSVWKSKNDEKLGFHATSWNEKRERHVFQHPKRGGRPIIVSFDFALQWNAQLANTNYTFALTSSAHDASLRIIITRWVVIIPVVYALLVERQFRRLFVHQDRVTMDPWNKNRQCRILVNIVWSILSESRLFVLPVDSGGPEPMNSVSVSPRLTSPPGMLPTSQWWNSLACDSVRLGQSGSTDNRLRRTCITTAMGAKVWGGYYYLQLVDR